MVSEKIFYSSDPELKRDKQKAYEFFIDFNSKNKDLSPAEKISRLRTIFAKVGQNLNVEKLYFSYGYQIEIGEHVILGDRVFLGDAGKIMIGDNVVLCPEVQLYTTNHCLPIPYRGHILAKDIKIKKGAQIDPRVIVLPGVTINEGAIVLEGSVVNRDVPPHTTVGGIPAKVISE